MDRHSVQWRGYIPAITTPFTREGALDLEAMERLLQWLLDESMHGIIIGGTQGESLQWCHQRRSVHFRCKRRA